MRGDWRLAAENLVELAAKVGDWPAIWHNIAVLRSWLADTPGAIEAWRKYAAQPIPLDDAVEAEALAQLLDPRPVDMVDVITIEYSVNDIEACLARLAANPRTPNMPIDLSRMGTREQPPPKGAYWLLDRDVPGQRREHQAGRHSAGRGPGVLVWQADRSRCAVGARRRFGPSWPKGRPWPKRWSATHWARPERGRCRTSARLAADAQLRTGGCPRTRRRKSGWN